MMARSEITAGTCCYSPLKRNSCCPCLQPLSTLPKGKKFPLVSRLPTPRTCIRLYHRVYLQWISAPMIVVEQSEVQKSQLDHDPDAPAATSSTPLIPSESPPAYTPRENRGPCSSSTPYHDPPSSPATQKRRPKSVAKRFVKVLPIEFGSCVAIIYVREMLRHCRANLRMSACSEPGRGKSSHLL